MNNPKVAIVIGSDSDFPVIKGAVKMLKDYGVEVDVNVMSAHRTPERAAQYAKAAEANGFDVIIAAAGKAAHLPGVLAAFTVLPVIGVPIKSSTFDGMDALLSIVQMPKGIPVATVAVDGADNAAILAMEIMGLKYAELRTRLKEFKAEMADQVVKKDAQIKEEVSKL